MNHNFETVRFETCFNLQFTPTIRTCHTTHWILIGCPIRCVETTYLLEQMKGSFCELSLSILEKVLQINADWLWIQPIRVRFSSIIIIGTLSYSKTILNRKILCGYKIVHNCHRFLGQIFVLWNYAWRSQSRLWFFHDLLQGMQNQQTSHKAWKHWIIDRSFAHTWPSSVGTGDPPRH